MARLLESLILGTFPFSWDIEDGERKIWLAARMGHGPRQRADHPQGRNAARGDTWLHNRWKGPWPVNLFLGTKNKSNLC